MLREFAPHLVADVLAALTPASCSAYVLASADAQPDDRCYEIEPWFGTSFAADAVPPARLARWQAAYDGADAAAFALPVPNAFLPSDFALRHERKEEDGAAAAAAAAAGEPRQPPPVLLSASPGGALFHKPDARWGAPKAVVCLDVRLADCRRETHSAWTWPRRLAIQTGISTVSPTGAGEPIVRDPPRDLRES